MRLETSSNTPSIPEKDGSGVALRASAWAGSTTAAANAMRCSMSGWIFALAIADGNNQAVGRRTITMIPVSSFQQDRRYRQAFVGYPLLSRVSAATAMPGLLRREGRSIRGVLARKVGRGSQRLEAKKSTSKSDQLDDFREAAKVLDQMERKREKKTQDRARRREANKTPAPSPRSRRDGELDGTPDSVSKAGQNPFKKEKVAVSRFDVSDIRKVEFVGSFEENESQWPKTSLPEIAFLGRSNVGKSSMLNTLFGESVAKVSKTPGRTRHINIFKAKNSKGKDVCCFADLPGYGYAKIGKEQQRTIETFLEMYLERRSNLKLLILLTDARREPLSSDAGILEYAQDNDNRRYKVLVVATKVDKLNAMETPLNIGRLREAYDLPPGLPVSFSAITGQGKKEIWAYIRQAAAS